MKRFRYTIILSLTLWGQLALAQHCWNTLNTITTKWDATGTSNTQNWNWTLPGNVHPVYLLNGMNDDAPSFFVELPYFCSNPPGTGSCQNNNTMQYEILRNNGGQLDIYPENGWELILKNFGTPNSVRTTIPGQGDGTGTTNPVFILYNRHTGRMLVFVALVGSQTANSAYLEIEFLTGINNIKRAVFAHADIVAKPLQVFDNTLNFKTLNEYAFMPFPTSYQWLVSETQTAYDPCTCDDPNQSAIITVTPHTINVSSIDAKIEGNSVQQLASNNQINSEGDGKTSFFEILPDAAKAGIKGYTSFDNYANKLDNILDSRNNAYKDKLVREWFDEFVKQNPQYQGVSNLPDKYALWVALGRTNDAYKKSIGIDRIDEYQTNTGFQNLKTIASVLPYVGTAIGLIDFFMGGGKEQELPQPSPPMSFNYSLKLQGDITNVVGSSPVSFNLPGHKTTGTANLTPNYNNILGVFNILKEPEVEVVNIKPNVLQSLVYTLRDQKLITDHVAIYYNYEPHRQIANSDYEAMQNQTLLKQFKIKDDIKYIVNPASKLDVVAIDACLVFEYKFNDVSNPLKANNRFDNRTQEAISTGNSFPYYPGLFDINMSFEDRLKALEEIGVELEYLSYTEKIIRFRTKYVPLTCLKNQSITLLAGANPKVYVKMLVKFNRNDVTEAEDVTQIVTYDLSESFRNANSISTGEEIKVDINTIDIVQFGEMKEHGIGHVYWAFGYEGLSVSFNSWLQLPQNLPFSVYPKSESLIYTGNPVIRQVNGTITIPNNTIIASGTWLKGKRVLLGSNVTISNNVTLISSEPIEILPETNISPEASLIIEDYGVLQNWNCPDVSISTLKASDPEIRSLCNSSAYRNRVLNKRDENLVEDGSEVNNSVTIKLHPNPANHSFTINLSAVSTYAINITDITGRLVYKSEINQDNKTTVDVSQLQNGIYFVQVTGNGHTTTQKIIVKH